MPDFESYERQLGVRFNDRNLLVTALTHRSYLNENREDGRTHNERFEFLGDAVLELIVTEFLFKRYPEHAEGDLTLYRAALVNAETLADVGGAIGLNDYLLLSKGERKDTGRARHYILANTFEALVGALYIDQGYGAAETFVTKHLLPRTDDIVARELWKDAKSRLQELVQDRLSVTPTYQTIVEEGPDHDKRFTIGVFFGPEKIAIGEGPSKQEAEQDAAAEALKVKGW